MISDKKNPVPPLPKLPASHPFDEIKEAIEKIRFGTVQIVIQDGRIVQIETTEKKRLV